MFVYTKHSFLGGWDTFLVYSEKIHIIKSSSWGERCSDFQTKLK